jgi:hypothetical protein
MVSISLLFCNPVLSIEESKHERKYPDYLLLENGTIYGVTNQRAEDGKRIPVEINGKEKVIVALREFTMKEEVTIDMLKPGGPRSLIVKILKVEKKISIDILAEWLKDENPLNREKAAYLLDNVRNTSPLKRK